MEQHTSTIRFTARDLDLFAAASGDRNPLHLDKHYAERTTYGVRVVFGSLGAIAALAHVPEPEKIHKLKAEYLRPMFLDVNYEVRVHLRGASSIVELLDGQSRVLSLSLTFGQSEIRLPAGLMNEPLFEHSAALDHEAGELTIGLTAGGRYRPDGRARTELCARWKVPVCVAVDALLWSSYVVGMEIPGKSALFFGFTADFNTSEHARGGAYAYEAAIERVDTRLGQVRSRVRLTCGEARLVTGECRCFIRPAVPAFDSDELRRVLAPSSAMSGDVALIIGSSRGLGLALTHALASQEAAVIAVSRSTPSKAPPKVAFVQGDAANVAWCKQLELRIAAEHGRLDYLVCSAFPPIVPLLLELNAINRINDYLERAVSLVLTPLCAFVDLLNRSRGTLLLISSNAVEHPVREWPHYIAAKKAAEALVEVAALQYPAIRTLIVRPERLLTEMSNTPLGRRNTVRPEATAAKIIRELQNLNARSSGVLS